MIIKNLELADLAKIKAVIDSADLFHQSLKMKWLQVILMRPRNVSGLQMTLKRLYSLLILLLKEWLRASWNLYLIAMHQNHQGKGLGSEDMTYVEGILKEKGVRILLVETSGLDQFERTRSFYEQKGYSLEARVRDFYQEGEDKIIYWKRLN